MLTWSARCPNCLTTYTQDRWEFAQRLGDEIVNQDSGSTKGREYLKRFDDLPELDKLGVRNLILGLCRLSYVESEDESRVLQEWLLDSVEAHA